MNMKRYQLLGMAAMLALAAGCADIAAQNPKREFRGAWMHTVYQEQYKRQGTDANKDYLCRQLDSLKAMGINAVIFQVRPQADAFYDSQLEPWSCFLTDGGKAPVPYWDPLEFMVSQCHKRGMELHAWLNPYRVTSNTKQIAALPKSHIYRSHPERFVRYGGKLYFDPGIPENREFIGKVVDDILARYDIDGIHFDDYFYPYPGKTMFPDNDSFRKFGGKMNRGDWRRKNVDMLIEAVYSSIHKVKPWVRFGVSPFGIWRNKKSDSRGSDTAGLENYDSLYADVLLWAEKGWVDYLIPQLYWERGHRLADYDILVKWWNDCAPDCQLYIGQDVNRCMDKTDLDGGNNQLHSKLDACRKADNIQGVCWWQAYSVSGNYKGVSDILQKDCQQYKALVPEYSGLCSERPAPPCDLRETSRVLRWECHEPEGKANDAVRFVVYRTENGDKDELDNPATIIAVTDAREYTVSAAGVYIVTSLNRVNAESESSAKIRVK